MDTVTDTSGIGRPSPRLGWLRWTMVVGWLAAVAICAIVAMFGFTVVPDSVVAGTDLNGNPTFDAKQLVGKIWEPRVLPFMQSGAADVATVLAAIAKDSDTAGARYGHRPRSSDGPWNFVVHGQGRIKTAETQLRHATLVVDVAGADVTLQVGPVVFGTALRDSLPFISFDQVVNQIQFAQISRELNDRATAATRAGLDLTQLKPGATVVFAGAMAMAQVTTVSLHIVTPAAP